VRTFEGKKNNRGELGAPVDVEFKNGLFVPVNTRGGVDKLIADADAERVFLDLLVKVQAGRTRGVAQPEFDLCPYRVRGAPETQRRIENGAGSRNESALR
jgi:hypothetical protein